MKIKIIQTKIWSFKAIQNFFLVINNNLSNYYVKNYIKQNQDGR